MRRTVYVSVITVVVSAVLALIVHELRAGESEPAKAGDASTRLREVSRDAIDTMKLFELQKEDGKIVRKFIRPPLEPDIVEVILLLVKEANAKSVPGRKGESFYLPDRAMVVRLKQGEIIEVKYCSYLNAPFGQLESRPLKEALQALTAQFRGCAIHLVKDEVTDVVNFDAPPVGGSSRTQAWGVSVKLTPKGELQLHLRIKKEGKVVMTASKTIKYGEAKVFHKDDHGLVVVYLYLP